MRLEQEIASLLLTLQANRETVLHEFLAMNLAGVSRAALHTPYAAPLATRVTPAFVFPPPWRAAGAYDARARTMLYQLSSRLNNSRVVLARLEIETAHKLAAYKVEHKEEVRALTVAMRVVGGSRVSSVLQTRPAPQLCASLCPPHSD